MHITLQGVDEDIGHTVVLFYTRAPTKYYKRHRQRDDPCNDGSHRMVTLSVAKCTAFLVLHSNSSV